MTIEDFAALHTSADPLVLFNIWDAGSAVAVAGAGRKCDRDRVIVGRRVARLR